MCHISLPILHLTLFHLCEWTTALQQENQKKEVKAIKKCGWHMTNELLKAFKFKLFKLMIQVRQFLSDSICSEPSLSTWQQLSTS
jgi:hypothetical protein